MRLIGGAIYACWVFPTVNPVANQFDLALLFRVVSFFFFLPVVVML